MNSLDEANEFLLKYLRRISLKNYLEMILYTSGLILLGIIYRYPLPFMIAFSCAAFLEIFILVFVTKNIIALTKLDFIGIHIFFLVAIFLTALLPADSFAFALFFLALIKILIKTKAYYILGNERFRLTSTLYPIYGAALLAIILFKKHIPQLESSELLQITTASFCLASVYFSIFDVFTLDKCKSLLDKKLAYFDQLTSIYNRRLLNDLNERTDIPAIAYLDIDHFKTVNDTFGHAVGDKVLISLCNEITRRIKGDENVIFLREGGEEFLIICKTFDASSRKLMVDLIDYYRNNPLEINGITINITLSIGVYFNKGQESLEKMVIEADKLLYYAKKHGRNCLVTDYRKVH